MICQLAHLFFPFSDAVTESMSWFWFAVYLRQTVSQFIMRRLQKVQFEDGLQRARGVNVKYLFMSKYAGIKTIESNYDFFDKFEPKQSYD